MTFEKIPGAFVQIHLLRIINEFNKVRTLKGSNIEVLSEAQN